MRFKLIRYIALLSFLIACIRCNSGNAVKTSLELVHVDYDRVSTYIQICIWLLVAVFARISKKYYYLVFHNFKKVSSAIPESW